MKRSSSLVNVGIDVGRDRLDVVIHERRLALSFANDDAGIRALLRRLAYYRLARLVLETTGRREQPLARAALARQLPVVIVNPMTVRRFAATIEPPVRDAPDPNARQLKDLVIPRRQLLDMATMEKNRLHLMPKALQAPIQRHISDLADDVRELDALVAKLAHWRERRELLLSMRGVGAVVANTLIAELPELGKTQSHADCCAHRRRAVQSR